MSAPSASGSGADGRAATRFARVAPPLPVDGLFTYAVPPALAARVVPGVRVVVPFGARRLTAMVVAVDDDAPADVPSGTPLKPIVDLVEDEPLVGDDILRLAESVARSTGCSVGEALDAALPRAVKRGQASRTVGVARLKVDAAAVPALVEELLAKREKQARTLRILAARGGELPERELMSLAHVSRSPLQTLAKAGYVELERITVSHDPLLARHVERTQPLELTADQATILARIVAVADEVFGAEAPEPHSSSIAGAASDAVAGGDGGPPVAAGHTFLLHGVTGSGKTEVYLQALLHVVASGRQGIVLVPEIALTPQTVRRFRERFDRVAVLHSHLTEAERHDQWRRIRRGEADVVVGARSAIFAPMPRLGLVVIDEEHETSFKQQNVPRYHAREVAIVRARLAGAVVVLGTATPSLEAWHRAEIGAYERLVLSERVAGGRMPEVVVVDLTVEERRKSFSFLTDRLRASMDDALRREGQVILFLNKRGWATVMLCRSCRGTARCPHCDVSMTLHRRIRRVLCHYCGHEELPPTACRTCGAKLAPFGYGTEKVEEEVSRAFPDVTVARMDSDTMSGRGAHERVLDGFAAGSTRVLVGTQMIAKGLDFPNTLLVGVICADSALFLPDYRAAERTFQLLAQVTGRTGRGPKGGRVVVQAYNPRHFAIRAGVDQDFEGFARIEMEARAELGYPPFGRLVRIVVQGPVLEAVQERATKLGELLRERADVAETESPATLFDASTGSGPGTAPAGAAGPAPSGESLVILGPAPALIPRINDQHRMHLVAKCRGDADVARVLAWMRGRTQPARRVRVLVDVDPSAML